MTDEIPHKMRKRAIIQVALLNMAVALIVLPLDSTLNRIMIYELALPATIVAALISLRFITSPLRIYFGLLSDTKPILGRHRTSYIAIGLVMMVSGFVLTPYAAYTIPENLTLGLLFDVFAFGLLGFGVNMTTPLDCRPKRGETKASHRSDHVHTTGYNRCSCGTTVEYGTRTLFKE